ncbi:MAG: YdcF family protein [Lachnospira sp.]
MHNIWLAASIICLLYYIICALYAGTGSSFIFIWMIGAVFFAFVYGVRIAEIKNYFVINPIIKYIFTAIIILGLSVFIILEALIINGMSKKCPEKCDYMIVLGCKIRGDHITKSLRRRLEAACEYANDNPETIIIVSGGKGPDENLSEAQAMRDYLVEHGISDERIIMEDKSTDTNENMMYSKEYIADSDASVAIVTSNFHLFRSIRIARHQGINNVYGIPSPSDKVLFINYMVREAVGIMKDFLFGNLS